MLEAILWTKHRNNQETLGKKQTNKKRNEASETQSMTKKNSNKPVKNMTSINIHFQQSLLTINGLNSNQNT